MIVPSVVSILKSLNDRLSATLEGILVFMIFISRSKVVPRQIQLVCGLFRLRAVDDVTGVVHMDIAAVKLKSIHAVFINQKP